MKKLTIPYDFGNISFEGNYVTAVEEKAPIISFAVAGIYVMKPDLLNIIPEDRYYGMDTLIMTMLTQKMPVSKYELEEYWLDIGQMDDYEEAQKAYRTHFKDDKNQ
jgi:NDP-sugar pyrophosphorylase family protein